MTHGVESGYNHKGCRCAECRAASAAARRQRRLNNLDAQRAYERARWNRRRAAK